MKVLVHYIGFFLVFVCLIGALVEISQAAGLFLVSEPKAREKIVPLFLWIGLTLSALGLVDLKRAAGNRPFNPTLWGFYAWVCALCILPCLYIAAGAFLEKETDVVESCLCMAIGLAGIARFGWSIGDV